jgi:hypothetical protein
MSFFIIVQIYTQKRIMVGDFFYNIIMFYKFGGGSFPLAPGFRRCAPAIRRHTPTWVSPGYQLLQDSSFIDKGHPRAVVKTKARKNKCV